MKIQERNTKKRRIAENTVRATGIVPKPQARNNPLDKEPKFLCDPLDTNFPPLDQADFGAVAEFDDTRNESDNTGSCGEKK